ncbi:uncharacterized protein IWZ02DRAFT_441234 [Phyllosticta citriasiana]
MKVLDVNLKSVLNTTFMATHYMIKGEGGGDMVLTSSAVGMYPVALAPLYASAMHGVLGLARSLAPRLHANHNIRVNALCPGMVSRALLADDEWVKIVSSSDTWTPISCVVDAVLRVVDCGTDLERPVVDSVGKEVKVGEMFGRTFECSGKKWYWRDLVPFFDETMEVVMGSNAQRKLWSKERVE